MQVSQQLRLVHRQNLLNRLQLENDLIADDQVDPVTAGKLDTFVCDRYLDLLPKWNFPEFQFITQASLVSGLQQPRSQRSVNLHCPRNDFSCEWLLSICGQISFACQSRRYNARFECCSQGPSFHPPHEPEGRLKRILNICASVPLWFNVIVFAARPHTTGPTPLCLRSAIPLWKSAGSQPPRRLARARPWGC